MNIAIVGWWGRGNMGDELILANTVRWLAPHRAVAITDHVPPWPPDLETMPYAAFDERADEFDLVLFGSGGVLNDRYVRGVLPPERLARIRAPLWAFAVGVPTADWLEGIDYFFDRCDLLSVRDERARRMLLSRHPQLDVEIVPDPGYLTETLGLERDPARIGLTVRPLAKTWFLGMPDHAIARSAESFVQALQALPEHGYQPVVFAHEARDLDHYAAYGVGDAIMLDAENGPPEIARCAALVTMRLHGGIVAFTQGTPVRVIDYQAKCRALDDAVPGTRIDPADPDVLAGALDAVKEGPGQHLDLVERMRTELAAFRAERL